jgi:Arc/MetJ-type ribon-helix-helix transcriptional regulator
MRSDRRYWPALAVRADPEQLEIARMNVQLTKAQLAWLQARVADGTFASPADAVQRLVDQRMTLEEGDLDWAIDLVGEARTDIAAGRTMELDEHRARNAARLQKLTS